MNMEAGVPPIVLFVAVQDPREASYSQALEEAGFWVARSPSLGDALRDIMELRPDIVVADTTGTSERQPREFVRAIQARSAALAVPVLVLDDAVSAPALKEGVEKTLAASRESRRRDRNPQSAAPTAARTCPSCGRPLVWVERGRVGGVDYDYYQWCANGCGLYCFELSVDQWLKLA